MAAYKGSIELISGITQKNGGTFPLVDASAVQYDDTGISVKAKIAEMSDNPPDISVITNEEIDSLFTAPSVNEAE